MEHSQLLMFRADGTPMWKIGGDGKPFLSPKGVTSDAHGTLAVSDTGRHCIHLMRSDDTVLGTFASEGTDNGQFKHPAGLCVTACAQLVVCDYFNSRVQLWAWCVGVRLCESFAASPNSL